MSQSESLESEGSEVQSKFVLCTVQAIKGTIKFSLLIMGNLQSLKNCSLKASVAQV